MVLKIWLRFAISCGEKSLVPFASEGLIVDMGAKVQKVTELIWKSAIVL